MSRGCGSPCRRAAHTGKAPDGTRVSCRSVVHSHRSTPSSRRRRSRRLPRSWLNLVVLGSAARKVLLVAGDVLPPAHERPVSVHPGRLQMDRAPGQPPRQVVPDSVDLVMDDDAILDRDESGAHGWPSQASMTAWTVGASCRGMYPSGRAANWAPHALHMLWIPTRWLLVESPPGQGNHPVRAE